MGMPKKDCFLSLKRGVTVSVTHSTEHNTQSVSDILFYSWLWVIPTPWKITRRGGGGGTDGDETAIFLKSV